MVNPATLVFDEEATPTAMGVAERSGAPMFGRDQGDFPIIVSKALPPLQLDHALEAERARQRTTAPGKDGDLG